MSTLRYSAMTSVIVRVADSVTESSSGKFIMETPQTSGTGLLPPPPFPAGQWQTDLGQAALCPGPCSPLLSTPLLTTPCSLVLLGGFVSGRPSLCAHCSFRSDEVRSGRFCWGPLISLSFNTVSRCKTVTLLPFDPPLTSFIGHHSSSLSNLKDWTVNISLFRTAAQTSDGFRFGMAAHKGITQWNHVDLI